MGLQLEVYTADETAEIYGRPGNIISVAEIVYSPTHSPVGLICSPATVRAILLDSYLFRTDEVNQWTKSIDTPSRVDVKRWVLEMAREEGLTYKAANRYAEPIDVSANLEDYEPFRWARNGWFLEENDAHSDCEPDI